LRYETIFVEGKKLIRFSASIIIATNPGIIARLIISSTVVINNPTKRIIKCILLLNGMGLK
jgi:hypothetical protein